MKKTPVTLDLNSLPSAIRPYVRGAALFDSSCSEHATTLYAESADGRFYLKMDKPGSLERENAMTRFLNRHGLAPAAILYRPEPGRDYLLLEAASGDDAAEASHLEQPGRLAAVFGESLRRLHAVPAEGCPYPDRLADWIREAETEAEGGSVHRFPASDDPANETVVHGDACLPNLILNGFAFSAFIDAGSGGVGDRHYDLYWGLWSLAYNLKTGDGGRRFLDAYGRDGFCPDRLETVANWIEAAEQPDAQAAALVRQARSWAE
ncbi:aminoglycoside 3'-phosphotransferase [Gorillibacterium sp. sgz500922]|uniref:aminoglycoside 3'-phosphotransferase n=1 Tax=Gorillibacterium sp. sgz500922 TaxID=3446694 RepID=UPI003F67015B